MKIYKNGQRLFSFLKYLSAAVDFVNACPFSIKTNDLKSEVGKQCCFNNLCPCSDCKVAKKIFLPGSRFIVNATVPLHVLHIPSISTMVFCILGQMSGQAVKILFVHLQHKVPELLIRSIRLDDPAPGQFRFARAVRERHRISVERGHQMVQNNAFGLYELGEPALIWISMAVGPPHHEHP